MNEFLRNGSGYVDPTARKALSRIEGENKTVKSGEIFERYCGDNKYTLTVVLVAHEKTSLILTLNDKRMNEDDVEVIARGVKYTTPTMISYVFNKNLVNFVRSMKENEFTDLWKEVCERNGFLCVTPAPEENELKLKLEDAERNFSKEKEVCHSLQKENDKLKSQIQTDTELLGKLTTERDDLIEDIISLKDKLEEYKADNVRLGKLAIENKLEEAQDLQILVERNFYKEQYEKLFERIIAG